MLRHEAWTPPTPEQYAELINPTGQAYTHNKMFQCRKPRWTSTNPIRWNVEPKQSDTQPNAPMCDIQQGGASMEQVWF